MKLPRVQDDRSDKERIAKCHHSHLTVDQDDDFAMHTLFDFAAAFRTRALTGLHRSVFANLMMIVVVELENDDRIRQSYRNDVVAAEAEGAAEADADG